MIKQAKNLNLYNLQNEIKATLNVIEVKNNKIHVVNAKSGKKSILDVLNWNNNRSLLVGNQFYVEVKEWKSLVN